MRKVDNKKLLIYVVAYNASNHIEGVLNDIAYESLGNYEVLVSDDKSGDDTSKVVQEYQKKHAGRNIKLITQETNLGYGGNQKFGYQYAIENDFDAVVLIHGDGQYSPTLISDMTKDILYDDACVVLGSRMISKKSALQGGMPLYKFIGNIILTNVQNIVLRAKLSEYHTGLRAYRVESLTKIPFQHNSDGFSFDTDILIQFIDRKLPMKEIHIPTHYGDEICRVNGIKYAAEIVLATFLSRLQRLGLCNLKKFRL